jgi:heme/copper-type cytochrome/quinol oxidase subunit 2
MRGALVPGGGGCSLSENCVPSSSRAVTAGVGQVQLYALCNDFNPEFFADRFGSDLTMTRSSSRPDYSISLVGGLVSRMRVTSGVVIPSDTPIHLICGSEDVIHSWAIPGLSVKVDCIPGYNCHRRLLVRWRGLFWGQCMEVCGRYHHWVPLLVHVTHVDMFALWLASIG